MPCKSIVETCQFIPLSSLGLSEQQWTRLSESNSITFGDANRTLVTLRRIQHEALDCKEIRRLISKHGPDMYVDLEN